MPYLLPLVFQKPKTKEHTSTISSKNIIAIGDWWTSGPKELSQILKVKLSKKTTSESSDKEKCIELLNVWVKGNDGDQHRKLIDLFDQHGYYNVSDVLI